MASGKDEFEVFIEELNVDVFFWFEVRGFDQKVVHLFGVTFVQDSDGEVIP